MKTGLPFNYKVYEKKGKLYVVIDYKDKESNKRKRKWLPTGLDVDAKKKEVNEVADNIASDFLMNFLNESSAPRNPILPVQKDKLNVSVVSEPVIVEVEVAGESKDTYEFCDFMKLWLETIKPRVARNTYKGYTSKVKKITEYFKSKNIGLDKLKPTDIQSFYNALYLDGHSGNNIKHYHANIHAALKYAVKIDLLASNPADKVDLPRIAPYEATFYTKDEINELFEVFKGDRMELVVHIGAYYGLRRSEICGLKWDAIDFERKTITVCRKVISLFGEGTEKIYCESELKTVASKRTLPLIPHIEKLLLEQKERQEHYSKLLKSGFDRRYEGYVCRDNFGKIITPEYVSRHFKYIIGKRGLKKIRFHDLRHSCASLLVANGVPMKVIQEWLGHSTFNVTANFYSHLDFQSKIDSAETIARLLSEGDGSDEKFVKND